MPAGKVRAAGDILSKAVVDSIHVSTIVSLDKVVPLKVYVPKPDSLSPFEALISYRTTAASAKASENGTRSVARPASVSVPVPVVVVDSSIQLLCEIYHHRIYLFN